MNQVILCLWLGGIFASFSPCVSAQPRLSLADFSPAEQKQYQHYLQKAELAKAAGDTASAIHYYHKCIKMTMSPTEWKIWKLQRQAMDHQRMGQYDKAIEIYTRLIRITSK